MTELSARIREWLLAPDGGVAFWDQAGLVRAHDPGCGSLSHVWLPRLGSVTGMGDTIDCRGCGITFFWDGMVNAFDDCPHCSHRYCRCCLGGMTVCGCP